jgi:hypothetical protein
VEQKIAALLFSFRFPRLLAPRISKRAHAQIIAKLYGSSWALQHHCADCKPFKNNWAAGCENCVYPGAAGKIEHGVFSATLGVVAV